MGPGEGETPILKGSDKLTLTFKTMDGTKAGFDVVTGGYKYSGLQSGPHLSMDVNAEYGTFSTDYKWHDDSEAILTITPRELSDSVTVDYPSSIPYDGQKHNIVPTITDGDYTLQLSEYQMFGEYKDIKDVRESGKYGFYIKSVGPNIVVNELRPAPGKLYEWEITPKAASFNYSTYKQGGQKVYDGSAVVDQVNLTSGVAGLTGMCVGDLIKLRIKSYDNGAECANVGEYNFDNDANEKTLGGELFEDSQTTTYARNYIFTYTGATKIVPKPVVIKIDEEHIYDGKTFAVEGVFKTGINEEGFEYSYETDGFELGVYTLYDEDFLVTGDFAPAEGTLGENYEATDDVTLRIVEAPVPPQPEPDVPEYVPGQTGDALPYAVIGILTLIAVGAFLALRRKRA